jgi:hypothetical protein
MYAKNASGNRFYKQRISVDIFSQQKYYRPAISAFRAFTVASERAGALSWSDTRP